MHHGELILRQPRKDELYWICTFVVSLIPWGLSRAYLTQETVTAGVLATLAVLVAVRVTLLKNWNVRRVAWTMDDRVLELDGRTILIGDIQSAFLRQHTMTRGGVDPDHLDQDPAAPGGGGRRAPAPGLPAQSAAAVRRPGPGPGRGAPGVREGVHHA